MSLLFGHEEDTQMFGNRILGLPDPKGDEEPVTKGYADKRYGGGPKELLSVKGNLTSNNILYKHEFVKTVGLALGVGSFELNVLFNGELPDGIYKYIFDLFFDNSTTVKVFLYGQCGLTGYNATTWYKHSSGGGETQNNALGGYFHRGHGRHMHFTGKFKLIDDDVINFGKKTYVINGSGVSNDFVVQKLIKKSGVSDPLIGNFMKWVFKDESGSSQGLNPKSKSYFYLEKVREV